MPQHKHKEPITRDLINPVGFRKTPKIATSLEMVEEMCKEKYGDDYFDLDLGQTIERQKQYNTKH